ncbi:MAG: FadR family transcriptional regulator [Deltaproteobacteria bacterium]|nr:FadR family transcriptional regulator [Deltaproteobacteria bacterium]
MAKLQKAQNLSLVEDVTRQIEEAILDGEYKPGDKLPSTRELQKILGASLGTVRESLTKLEQKGLLKVLKGAKGGFFVREITISSMMDSLETLMKHMVLSHRELYEFRATIEAGLVRLVVKRASNQQIKKIKKYLNKLKNCLNKGHQGWIELVDVEQELRREFLKVADNRLYEAVLVPIIDKLSSYAELFLPGRDNEAKEAYEYWQKIIPAIAKRNEDEATRFTRELLYHFMDLLIKQNQDTHQT